MDVLTAVERDRIAGHRARDEFFWLDLTHPSAAEIESLREALGLHPMALEDTREFGQRPKVDTYQDYVLVVFYTAAPSDAPEASGRGHYACRPHSVFALPAQRPSRPSPGLVQWVQPIDE